MDYAGGYQGKRLRVNLSTGTTATEPIEQDDIEMFMGGRGLGAALLFREVGKGVGPLTPENKLILSTGPFVGTSVPGSGRFAVTTKSPLTGIYLESICGGHFGPELKGCGYDAMIIEGAAEHPVYITITEENVEIRAAEHLWGTKTTDCQWLLKDELHDAKTRIACIGPAGENLVSFAAILSDRRAAGRGGAGAVMGSKNLKAIAIRGNKKTPIADPEGFKKALKQVMKDIRNHPFLHGQFPRTGSAATLSTLNTLGAFPCYNWKGSSASQAEKIFAEVIREKYLVKDAPCASGCPVKCSKIHLVRRGELSGALTEGPEYETLYALGGCCGVFDPEVIIKGDELCDEYGLDTISMGVSVGFAMECYEKGIITSKDTEGVELSFGNGEALLKLIRDTAYRRWFGAQIAKGTRAMAKELGSGSESFAMHAKGMELGGYDPRGVRSMALVFACGPRGGCHHANGYPAEAELYGKVDRFSNQGKGQLTKKARDKRIFCDSAMICTFVAIGVSQERMAEMISALTGRSVNVPDSDTIGERIANVERLFNIREGLRRKDDVLPERLTLEPISSGASRDQRVEDLEYLVTDFYNACGWEVTTGIPTPEKLDTLGLKKFASAL